MSKSLKFVESTNDLTPRIGGPAMIGGVIDWPLAPDEKPLTLLLSMPSDLLNLFAGTHLAEKSMVSVFSYYSPNDYFLDFITYHGDPIELQNIKNGYTKVIVHTPGHAILGNISIPAKQIDFGTTNIEESEPFTGSKIGAPSGLLQQENLDISGYVFALQLYGNDFPKAFTDIFFLSDAVGYLYLSESTDAETDVHGLFFVQTT